MEAPGDVPEAAVSVKVLLPLPGAAMLVGAKLAVTPGGSPATDKATAELNPVPPVVVSVIGMDPPGATLALVAPGVSVKLGAAAVRFNAIARLNPPPVAITSIGQVPAVTFAAAAAVIVTGAAVVKVGEEKLTVTPAGAPAADSATGELNPPCALMVRVAVFELPGETARLEELAASVKFEARLLLQLLTSRNASTEPSPVTMS